MKKDNEILDLFGKIFAEEVFDANLMLLIQSTKYGDLYNGMFKNLSEEQKKEYINFFHTNFSNIFFSFFKIFEDYEEFNISFEGTNQKVKLTDISTNLFGEHLAERGWILRFSKVLTDEMKLKIKKDMDW